MLVAQAINFENVLIIFINMIVDLKNFQEAQQLEKEYNVTNTQIRLFLEEILDKVISIPALLKEENTIIKANPIFSSNICDLSVLPEFQVKEELSP
jgi:hypothetical protein